MMATLAFNELNLIWVVFEGCVKDIKLYFLRIMNHAPNQPYIEKK